MGDTSSYDDAEVYNNIKNASPDPPKSEKKERKEWNNKHPEDIRNRRWNISLDAPILLSDGDYASALIDVFSIKNYTQYLVDNAGGAVLSWLIEGARKVIAANYQVTRPQCVLDAIGASFFTTAEEEKANTLVASDYKDPPLVNDSTPEIEYIVRRLTPQECALLQGMPTWWCDGLGTENPTEEQIVWWQNVFENYNKAIGKECKPKSRKQIEKWLKNPYSDSAACSARTIKEDDLQQAFVEALQIMIGDSDNYLKKLKANLNQIIVDPGALQSIDDRLNKLQHELIDRTERHEDYSDIAEEIFALREQREKVQVSKSSQAEYKKRIKELQFFIKSQPKQMEFDETLAKHLLSKITVFDDHVIFEFKSGVTVSVEM